MKIQDKVMESNSVEFKKNCLKAKMFENLKIKDSLTLINLELRLEYKKELEEQRKKNIVNDSQIEDYKQIIINNSIDKEKAVQCLILFEYLFINKDYKFIV